MISKFDADKAIFQAPLHKTIAGLARELGYSPYMLVYNLGKARKLDLVKKIIAMNKGSYKWHIDIQRDARVNTTTGHGILPATCDRSADV